MNRVVSSADPEIEAQLIDVQDQNDRINKENCMIAFSELWYWVGSKQKMTEKANHILKGLNGYIPVGKLTAVIGQSGSGKTTFLEVLSGVPTSGYVGGNIRRFVDGKEIEFALINQIPTLSANETVEEVIKFGCNVFNDKGRSKEEIEQKVNKILFDFNLIKVRNSMISTLSGGEKKRVSVARHLAGDPKVMVLDEPTSGLDTFNAFNMIRILKNLCLNDKCTIILSIHQPQKRIVDLFDYLISFKNGRIIFQGDTQEAIDSRCELLKTLQVESLDAVDRAFVVEQIAKSEDMMCNATEYQLETEYLFTAKQLNNWNKNFIGEKTPMFHPKVRQYSMCASEIKKPLHVEGMWTLHDLKQGLRAFIGLVKREMRGLRRSPFKILITLLIHIVSAVFLGICYGKMSSDILDVQNRMGGLSFIGLFIGILSISFIGTLYEGRAVYIEERNGKMYGAIPYFVARILPLITLMRILPTVVASYILYEMMGLQSQSAHRSEFIVVCTLLSAVTTFNVIAISSIANSIYGAATFAILFNLIMLLYGGMFVQGASDLNPIVSWIKYLSFYEQALEIVIVNEFTGLKFDTDTESAGEVEVEVPNIGTVSAADIGSDATVTIDGEFFLDVFGMDKDGVDQDYLLLFLFGALYLLISLGALQFLHRTTR